jgi:hypothetical protein
MPRDHSQALGNRLPRKLGICALSRALVRTGYTLIDRQRP